MVMKLQSMQKERERERERETPLQKRKMSHCKPQYAFFFCAAFAQKQKIAISTHKEPLHGNTSYEAASIAEVLIRNVNNLTKGLDTRSVHVVVCKQQTTDACLRIESNESARTTTPPT